MLLRAAVLGSILSIAVSALWYVRSEVTAQTYEVQPVENTPAEQMSSQMSANGCPSADEMSRNAERAGITEADIDELAQMSQQDGGIVAEPVVRERLPGGEIIYESRAVQTMTLTNFGVVACSSFGNELPEGEITYIGGPLDNQEK